MLVIGSGTGAFAALVAAAKGAESVCLVEKGTMWGGTAATSGGGLAVPLTYAATDAGIPITMLYTIADAVTPLQEIFGA